MTLFINYKKDTGLIDSYSEGPTDTQNECPDDCETLALDPSLIKFDPLRMKVSDGQLVMKG